MSLLDVSIVNVALPTIRTGLGASESDLQWIVSGYALTFGLVLVPAGRLGDAHGRRNLFVLGVGLFTLASAAAGLAQTAGFLIATRLIQGIGAGIMNPQISGLIQQLFRGAERGRAFGLLGTTIGVSTAVGPLLGGILIQLANSPEGWRWIFLVNLPIGVLAVVLAFRLIPGQSRRPTRAESMDPLGVLLLGTGVVLVLLPLIEARNWPVGRIALLIGLGLVALAAFAGWEQRYARRREPVVNLSLFRLRSYALGVTIGLLYFAGFTAIFLAFTIYLQLGLDYTALVAGLALTPFSLGSAVAATVGGRIVIRFGRRVVAAGLVLVTLGVGGSAFGTWAGSGEAAIWLAAAPLLVAGFGSGLVISPNITLTLAEVPVARAGSAGGVLQTGQRIGSAVGIASVGSVFFAAAAHGSWDRAYWQAMLVTIALILAALATALVDLRFSRRSSSTTAGGDDTQKSAG